MAAESKLDKVVASAAGKSVEVWVLPFLRDRAWSAVVGYVLASVGVGSLTVAALLSLAGKWVDKHPWATAGLGGLAAALVGAALLRRAVRSTQAALQAVVAPVRPALQEATPALDWSTPSSFMYVKIKDPLYHPEGRQFLVDLRIGTSPLAPRTRNIAVRSFIIELRLDGEAVGEYEHHKSDIPLSATETSLGKILIEVKAGDGPGGQLAFGSQRAAAAHQWNVKVDAHVICMLEVPGVERDAKLDYWTETQYAGVRIFGFTAEELRGAFRRIGTR